MVARTRLNVTLYYIACIVALFIQCICEEVKNLIYKKTYKSSIEGVEQFKYLGKTLTNQNSIQEEIKSRLKLGSACYYSMQNLLSSSFLSKNLKTKIYRTIILPAVLYGCKTWSLILREVRRQSVSEKKNFEESIWA